MPPQLACLVVEAELSGGPGVPEVCFELLVETGVSERVGVGALGRQPDAPAGDE